mmetsp:Transcript_30398/g.35871  ORF Transcript_30398/g.35871 Transcript_30398/m.35871 type:complete len:117 (+) Transcript_30398:243-593(+)
MPNLVKKHDIDCENEIQKQNETTISCSTSPLSTNLKITPSTALCENDNDSEENNNNNNSIVKTRINELTSSIEKLDSLDLSSGGNGLSQRNVIKPKGFRESFVVHSESTYLSDNED